MTVQFSQMKMIQNDISQCFVAPLWHFPCQKHSFLKYPIPEIPDDFENKSGTDRVLKKTSGSGRVSGTRWSLPFTYWLFINEDFLYTFPFNSGIQIL